MRLSLFLTLTWLTSVGCASGSSALETERRRVDASVTASSRGDDDAGAPEEDAGLPGDDASAEPDAGLAPDAGSPDDAGVDARVCTAELCNGDDDDCDGRVDEGAGCPCEAVAWEGRSYLFCDAPRSWAGARMHCETVGYSLAVVQDAGEDAFIFAAIMARGWNDTWIGHNDLFDEGVWVWLDGDAMTYAHWDEGEPNDGGDSGRGEDCGVVMTREGREAKWDDRACDGERTYVCESVD